MCGCTIISYSFCLNGWCEHETVKRVPSEMYSTICPSVLKLFTPVSSKVSHNYDYFDCSGLSVSISIVLRLTIFA